MELKELLLNWINKWSAENPPPESIKALYFGLMNTDKGYLVFVTGAEAYDPNDDDWAGEVDYQPPRANKYLLLPAGFTKGQKWKGVLELVAEALKSLNDVAVFSGRVAGAGYDDRELIMVKSE
jgi:hypothetical protein